MPIETMKLGNSFAITGPTWNPKIPSIYQIEAFSRCNLQCPFCLTGIHQEPFNYQGSAMDMHLFEKIVERDLGGSNFIELQMRGEPTLNKNLNTMVTMLREKVLVGFSTHGNTLHIEQNMQAVLDSHFVTISIDAGSESVYNKKRVGGNWPKLVRNLDYLFQRKYESMYPVIDLQFIEEGEDWEREFEELKELVNFRGWNAHVRSIHNTCTAWENPSVLVINNELCLNPWLSVSIKANGDVVACCMAFEDDPDITYGNLNEQSLEEIWHNKKIDLFRYKHLTNAAGLSGLSKPLPKVCKQCYSKSPALMHDKIAFTAVQWASKNQ